MNIAGIRPYNGIERENMNKYFDEEIMAPLLPAYNIVQKIF